MTKKYSRLSPYLNHVEIGAERKRAIREHQTEKVLSLEEAVNDIIDFFIKATKKHKTKPTKKNKK